MPTRVISYDFDDDHFVERIQRYRRLRNGEFQTLQEAIKARRKYLVEIDDRLRADEVLVMREDGTEEMVSVRGSENEEVLEQGDEEVMAYQGDTMSEKVWSIKVNKRWRKKQWTLDTYSKVLEVDSSFWTDEVWRNTLTGVIRNDHAAVQELLDFWDRP